MFAYVQAAKMTNAVTPEITHILFVHNAGLDPATTRGIFS